MRSVVLHPPRKVVRRPAMRRTDSVSPRRKRGLPRSPYHDGSSSRPGQSVRHRHHDSLPHRSLAGTMRFRRTPRPSRTRRPLQYGRPRPRCIRTSQRLQAHRPLRRSPQTPPTRTCQAARWSRRSRRSDSRSTCRAECLRRSARARHWRGVAPSNLRSASCPRAARWCPCSAPSDRRVAMAANGAWGRVDLRWCVTGHTLRRARGRAWGRRSGASA